MKKSTKAASLSAFVFPGIGQFYLKKHLKGGIFFIVAGIGFIMIMSAAFSLALSMSESIQAGEITLNTLLNDNGIKNLTQEVIDVFQDPSLVNAKIAMMGSWFISTIDAWFSGKKIDAGKYGQHDDL